MTLRSRLFLMILGAVLPAIFVVSWNAISARQQALEQAEREVLNLVRIAQKLQANAIGATRRTLVALADSRYVRDPRRAAECNEKFAELLSIHPAYTNFGAADLDGNVYCSALPFDTPVRIADRSYFKRAIESNDFGVGSFQVGRITGVPAINFGYPVTDAAGQRVGVVYAALSLAAFENLIEGLALPEGSAMLVIDSDGTVLADSVLGRNGSGQRHEDLPLTRAILDGNVEGITRFGGLDGIERIYAHAPIIDAAGGSVFVAIGVPMKNVVAQADAALARGVGVMLLLLTLVALIGWSGVRFLVVGPLAALIAATRRIASGDLDARSGLVHGTDEIGALAASFDDMAGDLQQTQRALKTLSEVNKALLRAEDEQQLLQNMCDIAVNVGNFALVWIGFARDDAERGIDVVAVSGFRGGVDAFRQAVGKISWAAGPRGGSLVAQCIRSGAEVVAQHLPSDAGITPWKGLITLTGSRSAAAFPLVVDERVIGAISVHSQREGAFDENRLRLLRETANDLGFGLSILRARREHAAVRQAMDRIAFEDALTGLPNYARFSQELAHRLSRHDGRLAVLLFNLDRFSEVNEALGDEQGDRLLQEVGSRLRAAARPEDFVARMRGDEFAVLMDGADEAAALAESERIQEKLHVVVDLRDVPVDVMTTAGIALTPEHGRQVGELLGHADAALRRARRAGLPRAAYRGESARVSMETLALASDLRRAIGSGELALHFQPKISFATGRVIGAEALVRWHHPEHGLIPPVEFIPLAEHTGQIKQVTEYVLRHATRQAMEWHNRGIEIAIAVNVSSRNLHDPTFLDYVTGLLREYSLHAAALELEITESAVMQDVRSVRELLRGLRRLGVILSIDDFGTGYSSLRYLQQLPVHNLKIDKSFVIRMLEDVDSETIVSSTVRMAHDLGLQVVAEGVENLAVWGRLAALGCDIGQGFHIARPMPAVEFVEWMSKANEPSTDDAAT